MSKEALVKQIEYYLSEENLQNDEFFYKEVAANKDHFVNIKTFLNCNKIKKLGFTKVDDIVEAVKDAEGLQLSKDKTMLRRQGLDDLPQFKPKKKVKTEEKVEKSENPYEKLEVVLFSLGVDKEQTVPFRYIQESLLKNFNIYSPYVRFNKTEGNFTIDKKVWTPELTEKVIAEGLKVGQTVVAVAKIEGEKQKEFWEKHGHHFRGIIDNLRKDFNKRSKQQKRTALKNKKIEQFTFGGELYTDINKLKSLFKNILCRNPNNVPLKQKEAELVRELLSYHSNGEAKLKDVKHFVVDVHPSYVDTRCLFIVREDGSRQDFSIVKCINNIEEKHTV